MVCVRIIWGRVIIPYLGVLKGYKEKQNSSYLKGLKYFLSKGRMALVLKVPLNEVVTTNSLKIILYLLEEICIICCSLYLWHERNH